MLEIIDKHLAGGEASLVVVIATPFVMSSFIVSLLDGLLFLICCDSKRAQDRPTAQALHNITGADPENLHGRWLTGWLPIVNHTSAKGVAG